MTDLNTSPGLTIVTTGDRTLTVHQAWNEVMRRVREIRKDERASGGGANYNFRGIDAVMNAVGPIFREVQVSCVPIEVAIISNRDFLSGKGTRMHEVMVAVRYRVTGPAGDWFEGASIGESADASDKATSQAMSVAYRTFLLQGLTMPTDDPDPDHSWTDRTADTYAEDGWESPDARAQAWQETVALLGAKPDSPEKKALREWVKAEGLHAGFLTVDQHREFHERAVACPADAPADDGGWRNEKERVETFVGLMSRQNDLALEATANLPKWVRTQGLTEHTLTRAQADDWLTRIIAAETGASFVTPE